MYFNSLDVTFKYHLVVPSIHLVPTPSAHTSECLLCYPGFFVRGRPQPVLQSGGFHLTLPRVLPTLPRHNAGRLRGRDGRNANARERGRSQTQRSTKRERGRCQRVGR